MAVNVSPRQFTEGDFPALVTDVLRRTGLPAARLEIEITETLLIKDGEATLGILQRLKQSGVRIALDDFGTGYSSLSYLQRFPFDKVKIDQSFIRTLTFSEDARAIVGAIVAMSHQLRLEVTAEGVETAEQLALLRAQRCDQIQGFVLSRPLPQAQVRDFILRTLTVTLPEAAEPEPLSVLWWRWPGMHTPFGSGSASFRSFSVSSSYFSSKFIPGLLVLYLGRYDPRRFQASRAAILYASASVG